MYFIDNQRYFRSIAKYSIYHNFIDFFSKFITLGMKFKNIVFFYKIFHILAVK